MNCSYALRKQGLALLAVSIVAVVSMDVLSADKKAKSIEDWEIRGEKGNVMSNTAYALRNITSNNYLSSKFIGDRGMDKTLTWDGEHKPRTNPEPRFEFVRLPKDKAPSPLKSGDAVAIAMPGGALYQGKAVPLYVIQAKQGNGIDLILSQGTAAEWEIQDGPKGTPITTNTNISLYNKKTNSYLIYAEREHGINLRWNTEVYKPRDHRK